MIESIALAFFPLISGALIGKGERSGNSPSGYRHSSLFFVLIGFAGILTSLGLLFIPDKYKKKLDRASEQKLIITSGNNGEVFVSHSE